MNDTDPLQLISGIRLAIGVGAWATPKIVGTLFGFKLLNEPEATYFGRLFGVRDIALAAGTMSSSGAARRQWLRIGLACDVVDAAAGYLALKGGAPKRASVMATATALAAAGLGAAALQRAGE